MTRLLALTCALLIALVVGLAGAQADDTTGVTATSILIGGTDPLSGPAAAFESIAYGADGYFKYVNGRGGVNGRRIDFKYLDDGYDPSRTVENVRELRPRAGRSPWRAFFRRVGDTMVIGGIGPEAGVDPQGFRRATAAATGRLDAIEQESR